MELKWVFQDLEWYFKNSKNKIWTTFGEKLAQIDSQVGRRGFLRDQKKY